MCWWGQRDEDHFWVPLQKLVKARNDFLLCPSKYMWLKNTDLKKCYYFHFNFYIFRLVQTVSTWKGARSLYRDIYKYTSVRHGQIQSHCWQTDWASLQLPPSHPWPAHTTSGGPKTWGPWEYGLQCSSITLKACIWVAIIRLDKASQTKKKSNIKARGISLFPLNNLMWFNVIQSPADKDKDCFSSIYKSSNQTKSASVMEESCSARLRCTSKNVRNYTASNSIVPNIRKVFYAPHTHTKKTYKC